MLQLDHLTVIAPCLAEGVAHVRTCLDIDVPFGQRHQDMGTHNHRLRLGESVYLEMIAIDPGARSRTGRAGSVSMIGMRCAGHGTTVCGCAAG